MIEREYSGEHRSGVCKCGHRWDEHYLEPVLDEAYRSETGEDVIPQECEHYGLGGMKLDSNGKRIQHCQHYIDERCEGF